MKKAVILNVYGSKNIGDAAICSVGLKVVDNIMNGHGKIYTMFTDMREDELQYKLRTEMKIMSSPYGVAIENNDKPLSDYRKAFRFAHILSGGTFLTLANKLGKEIGRKYEYIGRIRDSDIVIGMGGGYIRTKNKYKDYFGLILTLLPVYIAKYYKKPIVFLPMSFGNFASDTQKKMAHNALTNTTVMCRDLISVAELKKLDSKNKKVKSVFIPDLALSYKVSTSINMEEKIKSNYIVLTARKWLSVEKQNKFEKELISFVKTAWHKQKLKTYFVSMAQNQSEDDDREIARYISTSINNKEIFEVADKRSPTEVQSLLRRARIAVCTRMHSAILASTVHTPFITIGYEYKTLGLMRLLNLSEWHIEITKASSDALVAKMNRLLQSDSYRSFIEKLKKHHTENYKHLEEVKHQILDAYRLNYSI